MISDMTFSICPVCGKRIAAERVHEPDGTVRMVKSCPEHGAFSAVLWRGLLDWDDWKGEIDPPGEKECLHCGDCRGLCAEHRRSTCCTLLEVTGRCSLNCTFCFAGDCREPDPSLEQIKARIFDLTVPGKTFLQLSGGEPAMRDDLPEIVSFARKCGCRYIQMNTNGLRLAEDEAYVRRLAEAGLSFVFLQFDGVTDEVYMKLRKRPLLALKEKAIGNCGKYGIGVTLVPVIVPGVNEHQAGSILRYGIARSPVVRGVHFQPVSWFGRIPEIPADSDRFTPDQMLHAVVTQSGGLIRQENLIPSCCDHPMCGFHGDFAVLPDRTLLPLTDRRRRTCCAPEEPGFDPAEKNREFIGRRWRRQPAGEELPDRSAGSEAADAGQSAGEELPDRSAGSEAADARKSAGNPPEDLSDMDIFLNRIKQYGFTVTSMNFQDAGNLDFERLRQCSLHVYRSGRLIPFCAHYLSLYPEDRDR